MNQGKPISADRMFVGKNFEDQVALKEIQKGRKQSHWMWYIFPQLKD